MGKYARFQSVEEHEIKDYAPDLTGDASTSGGVVLWDMDQSVPTVKGYQALNSAQPYVAGALSEIPLGATIGQFSTPAFQLYAGGANHLWRRNNAHTAWIQSDSLGGGSFGATTPWRFTQFNDDVIAVNASIGNPQVTNGATTNFGNLGGSPPANAGIVLAINGQVLMFAGANWYASALGTDNNWTPNIQTQAGSATLYDFPGSITAAAPLYRNAVVFKQGAAWLGNYIGGSAVWSFQLISDFTGTWCQESVVPLPDSVVFIGLDDFYQTSGYTPQRIPNNLKEWFFDTADPQHLGTMQSRYDPFTSVVYWYFVSINTPIFNTPDRYVCWNTRTGRWGSGYLVTPCVPSPNTRGIIYTGLYFDTTNTLQSWTGAPGGMMLATAYFGTEGLYSQLMRVKPQYYVAPTTATVDTYHVKSIGQQDVAGPVTVLGSDGWYYTRQYDCFHRFQINTVGPTASAEPMVGAEVSAILTDFRPGGLR